MIGDLGLLIFVNALFVGAGVGVCAAAGWWRHHGFSALSLGLAHVVGVATYGVAAQSLFVLGLPLGRLQIVGVCGVIFLAGVGYSLWRHPSAPARQPRLRIPWLLVAGLFAMLALLSVDLWFQPHWNYDAWTLWTPKARALVALDGLDAAWFTSADVIWSDYPLLLPAIEAAGFRFTGYRTELLDLQSLLFFVGFIAAFADIVVRRAPGLVAWAALASLAFAPSIAAQLPNGIADVPLACQFALAGVLGSIWVAERHRAALILTAVLLSGAAATKVEGLAFGLALCAGLVVAEISSGRRPIRAMVLVAAAIAVAVVPWRVWLAWQDVESQSSIGRVTDLALLAGHADQLPHIVLYVASRSLDPSQWLLSAPLGLVAAAYAFRSRRRDQSYYVLVTAAGAFFALILAYLTSPFELDYHLATSARRVVTPIVLFLVALAPLLVPGTRGVRTERRRPASLAR